MSPLIYVLCLGFSFCSMQYFMLVTRLIGELTGDLAFWSAVCSGSFLCALGLGILKAERTKDESLHEAVSQVEVLLSFVGPLSLVGLLIWHMIYRIYLYDFGLFIEEGTRQPIVFFATVSQFSLVLIGYLSGREVGFINRLAWKQGLGSVQFLLALYHLGGLAATLLLLIFLAPHYEILHLALFTGGLNFLLALIWMYRLTPDQGRSTRLPFCFGVLSLIALVVFTGTSDLLQVQRKNFYYNHYTWQMSGDGQITHRFPLGLIDWWLKAERLPDIERHRGPYQVIDFVQDSREERSESPSSWSMFMDGRFQVNSESERGYHEAMAHVPNAIRQSQGGRMLVIGGGDGLLVRELLRAQKPDPTIEGITVIDIDPTILDLARKHPRLRQLNREAFHDPRVNVMAVDAFQALRHDVGTFDAIYVDILFPFNLESSRLYTYEFFALLARHLAPDGIMVLLSPLDYDDREQAAVQEPLRYLTSTLYEAGFRQSLLYSEKRHSFLLAQLKEQPLPDQTILRQDPAARLIEDETIWERMDLLPLSADRRYVNSILKPHFVGLKDPFF